jgi:hypothetical protein
MSGSFDRFIVNCPHISLGEYVCSYEMLVTSSGKCSFRAYMPAKPAKCGINIVCLIDVHNTYFFSGCIYCGKDANDLGLVNDE